MENWKDYQVCTLNKSIHRTRSGGKNQHAQFIKSSDAHHADDTIMKHVNSVILANTKLVYNIYTMLGQRRRRWADVV